MFVDMCSTDRQLIYWWAAVITTLCLKKSSHRWTLGNFVKS